MPRGFGWRCQILWPAVSILSSPGMVCHRKSFLHMSRKSSFYPVITRNGMPLFWHVLNSLYLMFLSCHHQEWYATDLR